MENERTEIQERGIDKIIDSQCFLIITDDGKDRSFNSWSNNQEQVLLLYDAMMRLPQFRLNAIRAMQLLSETERLRFNPN